MKRDIFFVFLFSLLISSAAIGQPATNVCPVNLGFETSDLSNWEFYTFNRDPIGGGYSPRVLSAAIPSRMSVLKNSIDEDPIAAFTLKTPNQSEYFLRLGNAEDGGEGEVAAYTFTVPPGQDDYSVVYHYASVFSEPGTEDDSRSPAFTVRVFDVDNGIYIPCLALDNYADRSLPGAIRVGIEYFYIPWSSSSINLSGFAGKKIRLEFTTVDCYYLLKPFGHFQYVYLDIDEGCNPAVKGNYYCNPQSLTLTAPAGFKNHQWFNEANTLVGEGDTIDLSPAPPVNSKFILRATQIFAPGCNVEFSTIIQPGIPINSFIVSPVINSCQESPVDLTISEITAGSEPGLEYTYFTDPDATMSLIDPKAVIVSQTYYIKARNSFGCVEIRPVDVNFFQSKLIITDPPVTYFPYTVDITDPSVTSGSSTGLTFSYWGDPSASVPLLNPGKINQSGIYYIKAENPGCTVIEPVNVLINSIVPNAFTPNGDGKNDVFKVFQLADIKTNYFKIYNRYGKLVFDNNQDGNLWDGNFEGKKLPSGNYFWIWDAIDLNMQTNIHTSGSVTLLR